MDTISKKLVLLYVFIITLFCSNVFATMTYSELEELVISGIERASWSNSSEWANDELNKANAKALVPIIFNETDLTRPITRKEFAYIAVRLHEILTGNICSPTISNPFIDVDDIEITKAYCIGITNGTSNNEFSPDALITREQLATMMSRVLESTGVFFKVTPNAMNRFLDDSEMSSWSKDAIYFIARSGIVK